ncbi:MAG: hypothetical protein GY943_13360 [Chloroflexi bacterium]|nr:hypothetical protein [Chloroflexota bacterium]
MNKPNPLTEEEIDELVVEQANDDSAWEDPVDVQVALPINVTLPSKLAAKAAFFARLHNMKSAEWIQKIIMERLDFEEAAFADIKRVMEQRTPYKT